MMKAAFSKGPWAALLGLGMVSVVLACSGDEDASSASGATSSSEGGSANDCFAGWTDPCGMCMSSACMPEALPCANLSECTAAGVPKSGCLAVVTCVLEQCGGCPDTQCTEGVCREELSSAGGPDGHGTKALAALGDCLAANCAMQCNLVCTSNG